MSGSLKPIDIDEDEELERISGLVQRDTLIRSLGIIEQVHRLLHYRVGSTGCTNPNLLRVRICQIIVSWAVFVYALLSCFKRIYVMYLVKPCYLGQCMLL